MAHLYREFVYELTVRENHLDTFGHINNATYLQLFEEARWEFVTQNGYGLKEIREWKKGPIILEANIKFLKEVTNREKIRIVTQTIEYGTKVGKVRQVLHNEKGEEACEGIFTVTLFDLKERKIIPPTPEWFKAMGREEL